MLLLLVVLAAVAAAVGWWWVMLGELSGALGSALEPRDLPTVLPALQPSDAT